MTIYQTFKNALTQRSKFKQHWVKLSAPKPAPDTRQIVRAELAEDAQISVKRRNPGMPRNERRALARAYASGQWKAMRAKQAEGATA